VLNIEVGETVRVVPARWRTSPGACEALDPERQKIKLTVSMFGRERRRAGFCSGSEDE
jgi:transcription antitermination factor NusG